MEQRTSQPGDLGVSRRNFLNGQFRAPDPIHPPWAVVTPAFTQKCSRCDACIDACPEKILHRGGGGFPEVVFSRGECTFCKKCLEVCRDRALVRISDQLPWTIKAEISDSCIVAKGVVCRSCLEQCEPVAIRFHYEGGRMSKPHLSHERCTGCGACVRPCPVGAVQIVAPTATFKDRHS